jgi:hypothetical protein
VTDLNEPNLEREVAFGKDAEALLENELLEGALNALINQYDRMWKDSDLNDRELREDAYRMLRCAGEFKGLLTTIIRTGNMAAIQIEEQRSVQEQEAANERRHGDNS